MSKVVDVSDGMAERGNDSGSTNKTDQMLFYRCFGLGAILLWTTRGSLLLSLEPALRGRFSNSGAFAESRTEAMEFSEVVRTESQEVEFSDRGKTN